MPKSREELLAFLDSLGIATRTFDHPPLFTVKDSQIALSVLAVMAITMSRSFTCAEMAPQVPTRISVPAP